MDRPVVVGLLGGIGSGKSAACLILQRLGAEGVCADGITRKLLKNDEIKNQITGAFGKGVLDGSENIDRKKLADYAFSSRNNLKKIESILHPPVIMETIEKINMTPAGKVFVIDAPLLLESGMHHLCDYLIFIDAYKENRLIRAARKSRWTYREIERRQRFQRPLATKRKAADFVISNNGNLGELKKQLQEIYRIIKRKK